MSLKEAGVCVIPDDAVVKATLGQFWQTTKGEHGSAQSAADCSIEPIPAEHSSNKQHG
ncbi:MAG: hypothetical protein ABI623_12805 [bacterium]